MWSHLSLYIWIRGMKKNNILVFTVSPHCHACVCHQILLLTYQYVGVSKLWPFIIAKKQSKINDSYYKYFLILRTYSFRIFFHYVHTYAALRKALIKFTVNISLCPMTKMQFLSIKIFLYLSILFIVVRQICTFFFKHNIIDT